MIRVTAACAAVLASVAVATPATAGVFLGNNSRNVYVGTRYSDHIVLLGGNDVARGGAGADYIYGGYGRDDLRGGTGADHLSGGPGGDQIEGGRGADLIYGGAGSDWVDGGSGSDRIYLGNGSDEVVLFPDGVLDEVWCGDDIDTASLIGHADPHDVLHSCEEILVIDIQP